MKQNVDLRELEEALDETFGVEIREVEHWDWDRSNPKCWKQVTFKMWGAFYKGELVCRISMHDTSKHEALDIALDRLAFDRHLRKRERVTRRERGMPSAAGTIINQLTNQS